MHSLIGADRDDRAGSRDEGDKSTVFSPLIPCAYSVGKSKWVGQLHCSLIVVVIIEMQSVSAMEITEPHSTCN